MKLIFTFGQISVKILLSSVANLCSFVTLLLSPVGNRDTRLPSFLKTFVRSIFSYNPYFLQRSAQSKLTFPFQSIIRITFQKWQSFEPLSSTPKGDRDMRVPEFFEKI